MRDLSEGGKYFRAIGPDLMKRQIEAQMTELEHDIAEYAAFMRRWRAKKGIPDPETGEIYDPSEAA